MGTKNFTEKVTMWSDDRSYPIRGFSTPQPTWKSRQRQSDYPTRPKSEGKIMSPLNNNGDAFHVIHKVPHGDSPYVKAKQVQLIEKDPSRAISLFWAAINAGDRVDSALKDMAVVMKQLNRSDEAIEAIKSFRHLCPRDSQDSIDNLLVELYKKSGRVEEEIEMLERKLKHIEEGIAFGGKRVKIARSQGKKVQITPEQEISRILGNLAWAYLQQNKFEIAEQHYRKALSLELDKNKQCNLAICLMQMNRITEAKCLLQAVRASCGNRQMDESYAKAFEHAFEILFELESQYVLNPVKQKEDDNESIQRPFRTPVNRKLKEVFSSINEGKDILYTQPRQWRNSAEVTDKEARQFLSQPLVNGDGKKISWKNNGCAQLKDEEEFKSDSQNIVFENWETESWRNGDQRVSATKEQLIQVADDSVLGNAAKTDMEDCVREMDFCKLDGLQAYNAGNPKKSWADMAEEEEQEESLSGRKSNEWMNTNSVEESNDENLNLNISPWPENTINHSKAVSSKNSSARRSLCFDHHQNSIEGRYSSSENSMRRSRLQVFRDITPFPDSP
ncbi:TPR_1 domain-containing protein [Cephalotus follicularis]|uniref:TPR_1 domain-containing protein n=1 Tax=Cephalotus follicularis TaxID=3775 RepID=A0A1Q3BCU0_CEPFO|nr:TPR_1 domain-containing protein [Cephalotus follicularis]